VSHGILAQEVEVEQVPTALPVAMTEAYKIIGGTGVAMIVGIEGVLEAHASQKPLRKDEQIISVLYQFS
jgi:hypothetical protein